MDLIIKFACDEAGAPALEYALLLAILGIGLISAISAVGGALNAIFGNVSGQF
jgi:Flp pilus assembly pilin Flp